VARRAVGRVGGRGVSEQYYFPDNTVLINFAVVDKMELLVTYLSGRARVTQAVAAEIRKSAERVPHLREFDVEKNCGAAIELTTDADNRSVFQIRKRFASRDDPPTKHLGESETLHVISSRKEFTYSRFLTEDRDAYRVAGSMGVLCSTTMEVFQELVARREVSSGEAFALLQEIADSPYGRTLLMKPKTHQDLSV
jgi:predicted nucleic acid-binding protein